MAAQKQFNFKILNFSISMFQFYSINAMQFNLSIRFFLQNQFGKKRSVSLNYLPRILFYGTNTNGSRTHLLYCITAYNSRNTNPTISLHH